MFSTKLTRGVMPNVITINPRISPRELISINEFLGGGLFESGFISKFSIFRNGRHKNDIIFLTNLTKN